MPEIKYGGGTTYTIATIPSGQSLSDVIVMGATRITAIVIDGTWTAGVMTFQASIDGVTFYPVYDKAGSEVTYTVASDRYVKAEPSDFLGVCFLKIRSGTFSSGSNQDQDVSIKLVGEDL